MGYAEATIEQVAYQQRIVVRTRKTAGVDDFAFMLAASKKVGGGQFKRARGVGSSFWHYPLSIETCKALRAAFGDALRVSNSLATWYRQNADQAAKRAELASATETELRRVPAKFAQWLRGYQRVGAMWIAEGYRGAGLVADHPGMGKTPETLAALLEAGVSGPVLVVCPKASVKSVWGNEARAHLPGVPVYLCRGKRDRRERVLGLFRKHMAAEPNRLRIVVVVAEMLRVKLGNPCFTVRIEFSEAGHEVEVPHNKISGMCPALRRGQECTRHIQVPPPEDASKAAAKKWLVPTGFEYPELFDDVLLGGGWSWIILDESHKLLGSLTVVKANLMGRALRLLPERSDRRRYALSGTPFGKGGRVEGMFGTLHWLWPDEYTSFWKWAKDVLDVDEKVVNRYGKTVPVINGPKGLRPNASAEEEAEAWERFLTSLGPRVLRRTKGEMLKGLPPKTYVETTCEMTDKQRKQYDELLEYMEITTPNGPVIVNGHLAILLRSQQLANGAITYDPKRDKVQFTQDSGKLDRLWEALDARGIIDGAPGEKLVVASKYNEFLDAVGEMLAKDNVDYYRLDGGVGEARRTEIMEAWQKGVIGPRRGCRVMLVNTKAGGVSINLDAADEMHIMDEDPDPGVNEQLEDRIHRASRDHKVVIYYYRTEGTIDYAAAHNVEFRRRLQHAVLDGRRGVKDSRLSEMLELLNDATEVE